MRDGNRLPDLDDGALETLLVADAVAGDARHEQHSRGAVSLRIMQTEHQPIESNFARGFIRGREGLFPVRVAADARGLQAGGLERCEHFVAIHAAQRLHTFEPRFLHGAEFSRTVPFMPMVEYMMALRRLRLEAAAWACGR